jgi:type II secretory pathway predicted ATPase ExeA
VSRHLRGITGMADVTSTSSYRRTRQLVAFAADYRELVLIHGPAGAGKTFAVTAAIDTLDGPTVAAVQVRHGWNLKALLRALLDELAGGFDVDANEDELFMELTELSRMKHFVFVIDEAQYLGLHGVEGVRTLLDHPECDTGVVLVAGPDLYESARTVPQIKRRIAKRHEFKPIARKDLPAVLADYHPMFAAAPAEAIFQLDSLVGHGLWGNWARILQSAQYILAATGAPEVLDDHLAKLVAADLSA